MARQRKISKSPVSDENKINSMSILMPLQDALSYALNGAKICKRSWNDEENWVFFNGAGYLSLRKPDNSVHNLILTKDDFVGDDWFTLE